MHASKFNNKLIENISNIIPNINNFAGIYKLPDGMNLVACTDGVGTKLYPLLKYGLYDVIAIDLLAMTLNDLVTVGAHSLFFQNYIAVQSENDLEDVALIITKIKEHCKKLDIVLTGGETALLPHLLRHDMLDICGFMVGTVDSKNLLPKDIKKDDVILGIDSNGVHSNGYSILLEHYSIEELKNNDMLEPTRIYYYLCQELNKAGLAKGFAHITGGGITNNINRPLKNNNAKIYPFRFPELFDKIQKDLQLSEEDMLSNFNCGVGMTVYVDYADVDRVREIISQYGMTSFILGNVE